MSALIEDLVRHALQEARTAETIDIDAVTQRLMRVIDVEVAKGKEQGTMTVLDQLRKQRTLSVEEALKRLQAGKGQS